MPWARVLDDHVTRGGHHLKKGQLLRVDDVVNKGVAGPPGQEKEYFLATLFLKDLKSLRMWIEVKLVEVLQGNVRLQDHTHGSTYLVTEDPAEMTCFSRLGQEDFKDFG